MRCGDQVWPSTSRFASNRGGSKRNKRPDITTFHGWVQKMREVGAQQLICVSAKGYSDSVVDEVATRLGPTVKLLTLEDLEAGKELSGFVLVPHLTEITPKFSVTDLGPIRFLKPLDLPETQVTLTEKVFSVEDDAEPISINDVLVRYLNSAKPVDLPPPHEVANWSRSLNVLINESSQLRFHHRGEKLLVAELPISLVITCDVQGTPIPVHGLSYRQALIDGALAWVTITRLLNQGREVELTIIVKPDRNGFLNSLHTSFKLV